MAAAPPDPALPAAPETAPSSTELPLAPAGRPPQLFKSPDLVGEAEGSAAHACSGTPPALHCPPSGEPRRPFSLPEATAGAAARAGSEAPPVSRLDSAASQGARPPGGVAHSGWVFGEGAEVFARAGPARSTRSTRSRSDRSGTPSETLTDAATTVATPSRDPASGRLVKLSRYSYVETLRASLVASAVLLAGTLLLGFSEQGAFGTSAGQLATRSLSCVLLFYYPFVVVLLEVRCLVMGVQPENGLQVLWALTYSPCRWWRVAEERGCPRVRAAAMPVIFHAVGLLCLVASVCLPLPDGFHPGLGYIYLGIFVPGAAMSVINAKVGLPPLDAEYSRKSGMLLAALLLGFISSTILVCSLREHLGKAFALLMPMLCSLLEFLGTLGIGWCYDNYFVLRSELMPKFAATRQHQSPSCCIALLTASAHSARLSVLLSEELRHPESQAWIMTLSVTLILAVPMRLGWVHRLVRKLTCGRCRGSVYKLALLKSHYQMGYPRFLVLGVIGLARLILGSRPWPSDRLAWVVVLALLEEVAEDVIVTVLEYILRKVNSPTLSAVHFNMIVPCGTSAPAAKELDAAEAGAVGDQASTSSDVAGSEKELDAAEPEAVGDHAGAAVGTARGAGDRGAQRRLKSSVTAVLSFAHFPPLPFWGHFVACSISMYHMLLFLLLMGGGTPSVLGLCPLDSASGIGRGVLSWPSGVATC